MPAFSNQFDQVDPFEPVTQGPLQDWADRAARMATMMLHSCSREQLTCWGRAVERDLQEIAARRVGERSPDPMAVGQAMTSPAEVRWQLTDIELLGAIDLSAQEGDLAIRDPLTGISQPVQLWRLRAMLALWKLADARELSRCAVDGADAASICKADVYAGAALPSELPSEQAFSIATSSITEAAVAVALAWEAYLAYFRDYEIARAAAEKKSSSARPGAYERHAEDRRARDLVLAWLKLMPLNSFDTPTSARNAALLVLTRNDFEPPLKKTNYSKATVFGWITKAGPKYVRWRTHRRRGKSVVAQAT